MTERGQALQAAADGQISELIALMSSLDEARLRLPCTGREKLGDGTVGASAQHTADNYQRIAAFVETSDRTSAAGLHGGQYTADTTDPRSVVKQLSDSRDSLGQIAELTDSQLDSIPRKDSFRFCDGQRTLEQVLASLLKHQRHQVEALQAATVSGSGAG